MKRDMKEVARVMKYTLVPQGTEPAVRLFLNSSYYDQSFIRECLKDVAMLSVRAGLGDEINSLEKLGLQVLLASSCQDQLRD